MGRSLWETPRNTKPPRYLKLKGLVSDGPGRYSIVDVEAVGLLHNDPNPDPGFGTENFQIHVHTKLDVSNLCPVQQPVLGLCVAPFRQTLSRTRTLTPPPRSNP